jgi:hypothetical protein
MGPLPLECSVGKTYIKNKPIKILQQQQKKGNLTP